MSNCVVTDLQAPRGHPVEAHGKGRSRKNFIRLEIGAWDGVPTRHTVSKPAPLLDHRPSPRLSKTEPPPGTVPDPS
jgi:hypothetical protein